MKKYILFVIAFGLITIGCNRKTTNGYDAALVQVGMDYLYESELRENLPTNIDASDSAIFAQEYITNWIKQHLLIREAESKLSNQDKEMKKEIENYRQQLIIYKYKKSKLGALIHEKISFEDIEDYYNQNIDKFILNRIIARVNYMIFPMEINPSDNIKRLAASDDPGDIGDVEEYIFKNAKKYDSFNNDWISLNNMLSSVDYSLDDAAQFLKRNKWIEFQKDGNRHIIAIKEYMLPGQQAPIDFVSDQIKNTIINQKKLDFLREIKDSLYNDALKYNKFRVFN